MSRIFYTSLLMQESWGGSNVRVVVRLARLATDRQNSQRLHGGNEGWEDFLAC